MTDFHALFRAQLGRTQIDPSKIFSEKLRGRIVKVLGVDLDPDMSLSDSLSSLGETSAIARRLNRPFDLVEIIRVGLKFELRDMLDELESMNPNADYRLGFFGRKGSGVRDMFFSNSDLFLSPKYASIRVPNTKSDTPELFIQTIDGFFDNLPNLKK